MGTLRFGELRRRTPGISEKMLTQELRKLVDARLVYRHDHGEIPPRVEYTLTEKGRAARPIIAAIAEYGVHLDR